MNKPSAKAAPLPVSSQVLACAISGLVLGRVVMGLSARHEGSLGGLAIALVFMLSGAASLLCFLKHLHAERGPRGERAPLQAWMITLGASTLAAIYLDSML